MHYKMIDIVFIDLPNDNDIFLNLCDFYHLISYLKSVKTRNISQISLKQYYKGDNVILICENPNF